MIFRLSQKLAGKIKVAGLPELPLADHPLTDWSAHLFVVARTQYVIVSNTKSLYSTVIYGRGVNDHHSFIVEALRSIGDVLDNNGLSTVYQQQIVAHTGSVRFAKALNRSVTGSMNELILLARIILADGDIAPCDVGRAVNGTLLSTLLGKDGKPYGKPREAMRRLTDGER